MDIAAALFGESYQLSKKVRTDLEKAIGCLPEDQQKVLHLHYDKRVSIKEIALLLKCSVPTTYKKLNTAMFKLKNQFNPKAFAETYRILYPEKGRPVPFEEVIEKAN